jgi:hypothetical protein
MVAHTLQKTIPNSDERRTWQLPNLFGIHQTCYSDVPHGACSTRRPAAAHVSKLCADVAQIRIESTGVAQPGFC